MVVEIEKIDRDFSVCKVADYSYADLNTAFCFVGKTDEEKSLVCLQAMSRRFHWPLCQRYVLPLQAPV